LAKTTKIQGEEDKKPNEIVEKLPKKFSQSCKGKKKERFGK
jgi:hypothetical protein